MFDNPRKELQRLEEQLLAAEEGEWTLREEQAPPPQPAEDGAEEAGEEPAPRPNHAPMLAALLMIEVGLLFACLAWWLLWK